MTSTHDPLQTLRSPSSQPSRRDSVTDERAAKPSNTNMLQIKNLLNPVSSSEYVETSPSPTSTAAHVANTFTPTPTSTPDPETPVTPASFKPKTVKDAAVFKVASTKGLVKYKPFECNAKLHCLGTALGGEIADQHRAFKIRPSGRNNEGLIADFPRHIPYASEKKGFFGKTGRDAFEVFQYVFILPDDSSEKEYTVMWDYNNGLMRVTPFFKACGFQKTTPAKALKANAGLIDLCHSITGGALAAQGYWVPYGCARAVCLTFCWEIRWALTPVFGPSFVTECLPPDNPGYKRFKVDGTIIRAAQREADEWRLQASRSVTPASPVSTAYCAGNYCKPLPPTSAPIQQGIEPRIKRERPIFKEGSPFASDADYVRRGHSMTPASQDIDDIPVSPRSSPARAAFPPSSTGWTSINRSYRPHTPPSPPHNSPVGSASRALQLLTQPHLSSANVQESSWRDSSGQRSVSPARMSTKAPKATAPSKKRQNRKRIIDEGSGDDYNNKGNGSVDVSDTSSGSLVEDSSDSDNVVVSSPPPAKKRKVDTRSRRPLVDGETASSDNASASTGKQPKSMKFSAADARAARLLLDLGRHEKSFWRS